jgi:hypothetical protein
MPQKIATIRPEFAVNSRNTDRDNHEGDANLIDTDPLSQASAKTRDAPSPTRYAIALISIAVSTVITGSVLFWINRIWERTTTEKKIILLTDTSTQNLVSMPENIANTLEVSLTVSPTDKRVIKSLFGYQISLYNNSKEAVDNVSLHLFRPTNVTLIDPPTISTRPHSRILAEYAAKHKQLLQNEIVFSLDLLGPGQWITFRYSGYSEKALETSVIEAEVRANKAWEVKNNNYSAYPGVGGTFYDDVATPVYDSSYYPGYDLGTIGTNLVSKQIRTYTGADLIYLILVAVTMTCLVGLVAWLLGRALSDQSWRSLTERLFKRKSIGQ